MNLAVLITSGSGIDWLELGATRRTRAKHRKSNWQAVSAVQSALQCCSRVGCARRIQMKEALEV